MKHLYLIILAVFLISFSACYEPTEWDEITTYYVFFDPDGGTINDYVAEVGDINFDGIMKIWVYETRTITSLPTAQRDDHTFGGWFTSKNGQGDKFLETTRVFVDTLLYAHWITP